MDEQRLTCAINRNERGMCIQLYMFGAGGARCAQRIRSQRAACAPAFNPHVK